MVALRVVIIFMIQNRGSKARDPGDIRCAGFKPLRHRGRHFPGKAVHAGSAGEQWLHLCSLPHIHAAGSLRPEKCLMPCKAKDIRAILSDIDGNRSRRLRCIDNQKKAVPSGEGADFREVCYIACHVGSMRDHNCPRILP